MTARFDFILTGVGNIGRTLLELLHARESWLRARYGVELRAVGLADSSGAAVDPDGLDLAAVVAHKRSGGGLATLPGVGRPGLDGLTLVQTVAADLLLEATPSSHVEGRPGLAILRAALARGLDCVLASKGPLALAYAELAAVSDLSFGSGDAAPMLRYSGAVGGAVPSVNVGRRDLAGARVLRIEAALNGTTQRILGLRARGLSPAAALAEAQRIGIAEPDPSLDLEGWDAACKLVILANSVLEQRVAIKDVRVRGIAEVEESALRAAWAAGGRMSLLAVAEAVGDGYALSVAPTALGPEHPLARVGDAELGIVYETDLVGRTCVTCSEDGPIGSVAAMLRDVLEVVGRRGRSRR